MRSKGILPRFSLRAVFAIVTIAGIGSAAFSYLYRRDRLELQAVRAAMRLGGTAEWENQHRFPYLPAARRCTELMFLECDLAGHDLSFLLDLPRLRWLYMSGSSVTDSHMQSIGRVQSLEYLNIGKSLVTDAGLGRLDKCSRLKQLRFARTAVKGGSFEILARLPMLEYINADACALRDNALASLGKCKRLRVIAASGDSITDRGVRALCGAQELEEVILVGDLTEPGVEPLFALPRLKHLTVHGRGEFWGKWYRISQDVWELRWPQSKANVTLDSDGALHVTWPQRRVGHSHTQEK